MNEELFSEELFKTFASLLVSTDRFRSAGFEPTGYILPMSHMPNEYADCRLFGKPVHFSDEGKTAVLFEEENR